MAQATTIEYGDIALLIGDGATSEAFTGYCGVTSLTLTTNVETNTTNVPDCEFPDLASYLAIDEVSRQKQISFSGLLSVEALKLWRAWDDAGGKKNVRVYTDLTALQGGGHYQGPAVLSAFEQQGERGTKWQMSGTIIFDGKPVFTPVA